MDETFKSILRRQFGASIDMLENALASCPESLWSDRSRQPEYWYVVYHTLFFLDLYLHGTVEGFAPPAPFTLDEMNPRGILPERVYSKGEVLNYLELCRRKCYETIDNLTPERAGTQCAFSWGRVSFAELLLYNLRHVQHHAGQLNLILRQQTDSAPGWVTGLKKRPDSL